MKTSVSIMFTQSSLTVSQQLTSGTGTPLHQEMPSARSNQQTSLQAVYRRHQQKKRQYERCVREVEHATFTLLVLSLTRRLGKAATVSYKQQASIHSEKRSIPHSKAVGWLRCQLSFALLQCSIMCIMGARSSQHHPATEFIDLQLAKGQLH